MDYEYIRC